ncbi:DUF433 domain-containing protein [candidate division KSB1 bacterium]|nr:DUF433 domain-containing protein [candidate division KSB1 bacterium]
MAKDYVEFQKECYRIKGTRVLLDSVVYAFQQGLSPETIAAECFPTLSLEQVYGAIAFYLANRKKIDPYLKEGEVIFEDLRKKSREADPAFYNKFMQARRQRETVNV